MDGDVGYSDSDSAQSCNVLSSAFAIDTYIYILPKRFVFEAQHEVFEC